MAVVEVPEWVSVRQAVQAALAAQHDARDRPGRRPAIAIYTDGSAPLENPSGQPGSAAIVLGFDRMRFPAWASRSTSISSYL